MAKNFLMYHFRQLNREVKTFQMDWKHQEGFTLLMLVEHSLPWTSMLPCEGQACICEFIFKIGVWKLKLFWKTKK